jgi:hypothetical protein
MRIHRSSFYGVCYLGCESAAEQIGRVFNLHSLIEREGLNLYETSLEFSAFHPTAFLGRMNSIRLSKAPKRVGSANMRMAELSGKPLFDYFTPVELAYLHELGHAIELQGGSKEGYVDYNTTFRKFLKRTDDRLKLKLALDTDENFSEDFYRNAFNDMYTLAPREEVANQIGADIASYLIDSGLWEEVWRE